MIAKIQATVPHSPGCYLYKDNNQNYIYVGKAKDLQKRMSSYFNRSHDSKTQALVGKIVDFDFFVTNNEKESLVLENNLIKKYQPKYNMVLKDDKNYPYLKITNEAHPRLIKTRNVVKDGGKYFGPFVSGSAMEELYVMLNREFTLRKCYKIPKKECLYYHIGQCYAPCIQTTDVDEVALQIKMISHVLEGKNSVFVKKLTTKMMRAAENLEFEKAADLKRNIATLNDLKVSQVAQLQNKRNLDVISLKIFSG